MIDVRADTIEALFPAHVDVRPPAPRAPVSIVPVEQVVGRWAAG
jgi:hypothetical protein